MCEPTVLLITEFLTLITLVILTKYTDLTSAGVSNNCGYRSHVIVTAGCNICMIRLLHIQPSYIPCVALADSKFYLPALLDLQVLNELVQVSYHGCGLWLRQNRTAHETFSWEMCCMVKKGGN